MMLLIAGAIALSLTTVELPGGVLELPSGCSGPAKMQVMTDSYMGFISCDENKTRIMLEGSPMSPGACGKDDVQFKSRHGAPLVTCIRNRQDPTSKKPVPVMFVDLGTGTLQLDVKEPQDVFLLLRIASSFRGNRTQ